MPKVDRVAWMLLALGASVGGTGCAQWQHASGRSLMAQIGDALGDGPSAAPRVAAPRPSTRNVQTASFNEPGAPEAAPSPAAGANIQPATAAPPPSGDTCCDPCVTGEECCCPLLGACGACRACLAGQSCRLLRRPEPGPPPVRYRPELPPKFLPVPTQPTLAPARPDAPEPWRGDVEVGWRSELKFPARD